MAIYIYIQLFLLHIFYCFLHLENVKQFQGEKEGKASANYLKTLVRLKLHYFKNRAYQVL